MDRVGELAGVLEVRRCGFAPDQVGIRGVGQATRNPLVDAGAGAEEAFHRALAAQERAVVLINIAGDEIGRIGVGARQNDGRGSHDVGGQACGGKLTDGFAGRHEHLAAHVAALLDGGKLVFEVHARRACVDHGFHQFEGIEHTAKAGFCIGDDGREVINVVLLAGILAFHPLNLVAAGQRVVDATNDLRDRVDRIQRLVGVHFAGDVGIARHLPAREIDGLETSLHLLHGLVAGHGAQCVDEGLAVEKAPELFGAAARERMFDGHRSTQTDHVLCAVIALDPLPAGVFCPVFLQLAGGLFTNSHGDAPEESE